MTDSRDTHDIFGPGEPARDATLGALLGSVVPAPPFGDVDWPALSARIASARARQRQAWWSYAARWERRALPVAIAAGLAGVLALWSLGMPVSARATTTRPATEAVAALVEGAPAADVARSWTRDVGSADEQAGAEVY